MTTHVMNNKPREIINLKKLEENKKLIQIVLYKRDVTT